MKDTINIIKVSSIGDQITPLGLACIQSELKVCNAEYTVSDIRFSSYSVPESLEYSFERGYLSDCIINHIELPLALYLSTKLLSDTLNTSNEIFRILAANYAEYLQEDSATTTNRVINIVSEMFKLLPQIFDMKGSIGFSVNYTNILETVVLSSMIKYIDPSRFIIWGGPTITQSYNEYQVFNNICDYFNVGRFERMHCNKLYTPDYTGIDLSTYVMPISLYTSRGCVNSCSFCSEYNLLSKGLEVREIAKVVEDIKQLQKEYNTREVVFADSLLNYSKEHMHRLFMEIGRTGIRCGGLFRANLDVSDITLLEDCGVSDVAVGFETMESDLLDQVGKNVTSNTNKACFNLLSASKLHTRAMLIVGLGTDETEKNNHIKNMQLVSSASERVSFRPAPIQVIPGSRDYEELQRTGAYGVWKAPSKELKYIEDTFSKLPYTFKRKCSNTLIKEHIKEIMEYRKQHD